MSSHNLQWFPFNPSDWLNDIDLCKCDCAAKGAWIELICRAWTMPRPGFFQRSDGTPITEAELAMFLRPELDRESTMNADAVRDLISAGVLKLDEESGAFYCKRIVEEYAKLTGKRETEAERLRRLRDAKSSRKSGKKEESVQVRTSTNKYVQVRTSLDEMRLDEKRLEQQQQHEPDDHDDGGHVEQVPVERFTGGLVYVPPEVPADPPPDRDDADFREAMDELVRAGFHPGKAYGLACRRHATAAYCRHWCGKAKAQGSRGSLGLIVKAIEQAWPIEELRGAVGPAPPVDNSVGWQERVAARKAKADADRARRNGVAK